ncbi:hypothetical protein [Halorussus halobius]|uniref:hypothetical protein n=1 Tax=Halorussus halobius TaxID=1710537 RepID=UPI00109277A6|nr:hypothetical protein [Halorussus halobius]
MPEDGNSREFDRRTVLQTLGISGTGVGALASVVKPAVADESDVDISDTTLGAEKARRLYGRVQDSSNYRSLATDLRGNGFSPRPDAVEAQKRVLDTDSLRQTSVLLRIPFDGPGRKRADAYVLFPKGDDVSVVGVIRDGDEVVERYVSDEANGDAVKRFAPDDEVEKDGYEDILTGCGGPYNIADICWILDLLALAGSLAVQLVPVPGDEAATLGTVAEILTGSCVVIETINRLTDECNVNEVYMCHVGTALYVKPACTWDDP